MPGVIVPRKTVAELRRLLDDAEGAIDISLSDTKIQFCDRRRGADLEADRRHISRTISASSRPATTRCWSLDSKEFAHAVDRVSTISADKTRAVKLNLAQDRLTLTVVNPDSGTATEELGATYSAAPIEIGFNARYLLDITGQIEGKEVRFLLSDAGSPDDHRGHR